MRGDNSDKKINPKASGMDTNEKLVRYYTRYVTARSGLEKEDVSQELRVETWAAGKAWDPSKGDTSWNMFLAQRLKWKASKLIRSVARRLTVENAFRSQFTLSLRVVEELRVADFAAPSFTLCCLSYELGRNLQSSEARKVFRALQTPAELIFHDHTETPCPTVRHVASYLGIAELSVLRGLREIKRHLRVLLNEPR